MLNYRVPIQISQYKYQLPLNLIANKPSSKRDHCRLMMVDRKNSQISHRYFYELADILTPDDVLVLNQSKVFPARIFGKKSTGARVEVLLYQQIDSITWLAITRPGLKVANTINFSHNLSARVLDRNFETGETKIKFDCSPDSFFPLLQKIGLTPIPPYIKPTISETSLRKKYQTVYAKNLGSAAAPTAGLHFTQNLLDRLKQKGVQIEYITLHVGLGTFQPLRQHHLDSGKLHSEVYEIEPNVASRLNQAKKQGKRIIAVGTTSARTLESATQNGQIIAGQKTTEIFIYPPYKFKFVDALITNFHLPESSLLMMVTAFASAPNSTLKSLSFSDSLINQAYQQAIKNEYRFFSFGDAMFII